MYSLFQNKKPTLTTHKHRQTYHLRLQHDEATKEYLCHLPLPSLATVVVLVCLAPHQSLRHASDQVLQVRISFPRFHISIWSQQVRDPLFELQNGNDFVILQILELPDGQIFPQLSPNILNWIQIPTARWEATSWLSNHVCGIQNQFARMTHCRTTSSSSWNQRFNWQQTAGTQITKGCDRAKHTNTTTKGMTCTCLGCSFLQSRNMLHPFFCTHLWGVCPKPQSKPTLGAEASPQWDLDAKLCSIFFISQ